MKRKIWLFHIPMVALFAFAFWVGEASTQGELSNPLLRERVHPTLQTITGWFTNMKFHLRGEVKPKNKVVIVEVDSASIDRFGRWPWHRDVTGYLVRKTFEAGAKVVGLDITFSEPDQRIPDELAALMTEKKLDQYIPVFETDYKFLEVIQAYRDKLVMGWTSDLWCQPAYMHKTDDCIMAIENPKDYGGTPEGYEKFAYSKVGGAKFEMFKTPLISTYGTLIANIPMYTDAAAHAGYFQAWPDKDGYIRRAPLAMVSNGHIYPSLAFEMARVGLEEEIEATLNDDSSIKTLGFAKSGRKIPVTPLGVMDINFRGKGYTYQYIRAMEVMSDSDEIEIIDEASRILVKKSKSEMLKDAYVLVGVSAVGVFEMRAFPFDSNVPGVEGHANILDNILSGDPLVRATSYWHLIAMFLLLTVGMLLFAYFTERFESVPALLLFTISVTTLVLFDLKILFKNNINWNTSLVYIEMLAIFILTIAVKYVMEERNKKFIKGAFSKYVAPVIVDSILKDPTKLSVGGEKKELTILFSDIRSFTSFSEKMDAKALAAFLNDYLGIMTDLVFDNEGTLDKYIGDAVMAFWGAPLDQPKHAANALKAAVKMMQSLAEHQPRFKSQYGLDVNIGIGVNSGPVNVGNMGSERIFEYTVIGDHVNLASRLEGLTKPYAASIVTTRFTFDMIEKAGEAFPEHRILDFVKVKGKKKAVELIQVLDRPYDAKGLKLFTEARELYQAQKWDEAIAAFTAANELCRLAPDKPDGTSLMYIERCQEFKQAPPAPDWDGSWEMHSK